MCISVVIFRRKYHPNVAALLHTLNFVPVPGSPKNVPSRPNKCECSGPKLSPATLHLSPHYEQKVIHLRHTAKCMR